MNANAPEVVNVNVTEAPKPVDTDAIENAVAGIKESKAGWKTTEFWLAVATALGVIFNAIPMQDSKEGWAVTGIAIAYAVARGLAKQGIPHVE